MNDGKLWRQLNAYADGELQGEARERLLARVAEDPALQESLQRIHAVKRVLAIDRPPPRKPRRSWLAPGAAVAACVAAVLVAVFTYLPPAPDRSWKDQLITAHRTLSGETFVVEQNRPLPVVSSRRLNDFAVPDLRASRLYLVTARSYQEAETEYLVMHYRGLRGCRLTIAAMGPIAGTDDAAGGAPAQGSLFAGWRVGTLGFAVIAEGMDADRFRAITDYARAAIDAELEADDPLRTAMTETYRAANPCA